MNTYSRSFPAPFYVTIVTAADRITLRQQVRSTARELDISLSQQAKLTTAASSIATAVLDQCAGVTWMVRVVLHRGQHLLEVVCMIPRTHEKTEAMWIDLLPLATATQLVDHASVVTELGRVMIRLQVRIVPDQAASLQPGPVSVPKLLVREPRRYT